MSVHVLEMLGIVGWRGYASLAIQARHPSSENQVPAAASTRPGTRKEEDGQTSMMWTSSLRSSSTGGAGLRMGREGQVRSGPARDEDQGSIGVVVKQELRKRLPSDSGGGAATGNRNQYAWHQPPTQ
ncbi:hypothetical protein AXG93_700s1130 [Marchantia polymorpha subsp. ruderalis]|uniref:Uncharacterized protein n=1 Tax=Marchantia polymorpha subsp. ruderalis TaxID=1480154 RepID=A0A176WQ36_MARPO|nr:hypothetical protein AXG93_700s1130 [Marchantia polymorpha subsp. ruderalis]